MQQHTAPFKETVEALQGVVERITYHSDESGYTRAWLKGTKHETSTIGSCQVLVKLGQIFQLFNVDAEFEAALTT